MKVCLRKFVVLLLVMQLGLGSVIAQPSFFDNDPHAVKIVPKKINELAAPITIEPYAEQQAMGTAGVSGMEATGLITIEGFLGTGFGVNGYIVSAAHVIRGIKPQDAIKFKGDNLSVVSKDTEHDLCVLVGDKEYPSVDISTHEVEIDDCFTSVGYDGKGSISLDTHVVKAVDDVSVYTTGLAKPGRSGSGLYDKEGKLVAIFVGFSDADQMTVNGKSVPNIHKNQQVYHRVKYLIPLLTPKSYKVTFYSGKSCTFCKQQHAITDNVNDRRIVADWTEDALPDYVRKKLPQGYQFPVAVWECPGNKVSWPQKSGVNTIDILVSMCEKSNAVPIVSEEAMGARGSETPCGAIAVGSYIDELLGWYNTYIPNCVVSLKWSRSGVHSFNVYGGKPVVMNLQNIMGKTGGFEIDIIYKGDVAESDKLQVRHLKFAYEILNDENVKFIIDDVTVYGVVKQVNEKLVFKTGNDTEQPKGFIGIMTLWTIVSTARTIWILLHPVADICIGGELELSTYLDTMNNRIVVDFQKCPSVRILSLMTFNLMIKQVTFDTKHIVSRFTGTMFAKQYTLDVK